MWNTKFSKESIFFRQRTQAQRVHLMKISTTKSSINCKNECFKKNVSSINDSPSFQKAFHFKSRQNEIENENNILISKIASMHLTKKQPFKVGKKNIYSSNLVEALSRKRKKDFMNRSNENNKVFTRITNVSSTIDHHLWEKSSVQNSMYRNSIRASRFKRPDFTKQALKTPISKHKSFTHLKFKLLSDKSLPNISKRSNNVASIRG